MTSQEILRADVLDILFEKRNKLYGAYTLRKNYVSRLYLSLSIAFLISSTDSRFLEGSGLSTYRILL